MYHLFSSLVQVLEPISTMNKGAIVNTSWEPVQEMFDPWYGRLTYMKCRLDLQFIRPGKDALPAQQAGVQQDRQGLMFCLIPPGTTGNTLAPFLRAGQRIVCVAGPVKGKFDIKSVPDLALDFNWAHHIEVQVFEVNQNRRDSPFPGAEPTVGYAQSIATPVTTMAQRRGMPEPTVTQSRTTSQGQIP